MRTLEDALCTADAVRQLKERGVKLDADMQDQLSLADEIARLRKGIDAVEQLIGDSTGVAGLHMNGDLAPWDELRTGGRYEEWLADFDAALERPNVLYTSPHKTR